MQKSDVKEFTWKEDDFYADFNLPKTKLVAAELNDAKIEDDSIVQSYLSVYTPDVSSLYTIDKPDTKQMGGPTYI
jgi:hypothetical protein